MSKLEKRREQVWRQAILKDLDDLHERFTGQFPPPVASLPQYEAVLRTVRDGLDAELDRVATRPRDDADANPT